MQTLDAETTQFLHDEFDERMAKQIRRGRELVESGNLTPDGLVDSLCIMRYREQQKERVARTGYCAVHCECDQVTTRNGQVVCPHTFEPCQTQRIGSLVALYSQLGSGRAVFPANGDD